jgi:hypothetical protein
MAGMAGKAAVGRMVAIQMMSNQPAPEVVGVGGAMEGRVALVATVVTSMKLTLPLVPAFPLRRSQ